MIKQPLYKQMIALALFCIILFMINTAIATSGDAVINGTCAALLAIWAACACFFKRCKPDDHAWFFITGGFVICTIFVFKLPYTFSFHDITVYPVDFSLDTLADGHLAYIGYIAETGHLPTESPLIARYSIFYNPPFYHLVQAALIQVSKLLNISPAIFVENTQIVTLFAAGGCMLVTRQLLEELGATGKGIAAGMLMFCFQPMLYLYGATINNDILSVLLIEMTILYTLRWRRTQKLSDIMFIALSLGLGMATKLSVATLIPSIAIVFVVCFLQNLPAWRKYCKQFVSFLLISVPIATAWPLYQLIVNKVPLNYVRLPSEVLNVSEFSFAKRFGIPDWHAIRSAFFKVDTLSQHNIWMQTLKTGVYDELILFEEGTWMWYAAYLFIVMFAALLLISLGLFIRMLISKKHGIATLDKVFISSYAVLLIGSYLKFYIDYPYICSTNFRYITPILMLCALAIAIYRSTASSKRSLWVVLYSGVFAVYGLGIYALHLLA